MGTEIYELRSLMYRFKNTAPATKRRTLKPNKTIGRVNKRVRALVNVDRSRKLRR